jgi:hypothetical protein
MNSSQFLPERVRHHVTSGANESNAIVAFRTCFSPPSERCVCVRPRGRPALMSRSLSEAERENLAAEIAAVPIARCYRTETRWRILSRSEAPHVSAASCRCRRSPTEFRSRRWVELSQRRRVSRRPATCSNVLPLSHARRPLKLTPLRTLEPGTILIRASGWEDDAARRRRPRAPVNDQRRRRIASTGTNWAVSS